MCLIQDARNRKDNLKTDAKSTSTDNEMKFLTSVMDKTYEIWNELSEAQSCD